MEDTQITRGRGRPKV